MRQDHPASWHEHPDGGRHEHGKAPRWKHEGMRWVSGRGLEEVQRMLDDHLALSPVTAACAFPYAPLVPAGAV